MDERTEHSDQVRRMFDRIAHRYDLLNRLLSGRQDVLWRWRLSRCLPKDFNEPLLDIATGTADQLISIKKRCCQLELVTGLDMSAEMLRAGQRKLKKRSLNSSVTLIRGDGLSLPFSSGVFGAVTIAFGIRNMANVSTSLKEMYRILKTGGILIILEFSLPQNRVFRSLYLWYFRNVLPIVGTLISGDRDAYRYLNRTVESFPYGQDFCNLLKNAGFSCHTAIPLTFGIATIYHARKN